MDCVSDGHVVHSVLSVHVGFFSEEHMNLEKLEEHLLHCARCIHELTEKLVDVRYACHMAHHLVHPAEETFQQAHNEMFFLVKLLEPVLQFLLAFVKSPEVCHPKFVIRFGSITLAPGSDSSFS